MRIHALALLIALGVVSACDKTSTPSTNDKSEKSEKGKKKQDKADDDEPKNKKNDKEDDDVPAMNTADPKSCPTGSKGKGTTDEPCTGSDRAVVARWTGKWSDAGPVFKVTNTLKGHVDYAVLCVYYYDADGKPLTFRYKTEPTSVDPRQCDSSSGGVIDIDPGETKEIAWGLAKNEAPKATDNVEAELQEVGWDKPGGDEMYWENDSLTGAGNPDHPPRPMGGFPQW